MVHKDELYFPIGEDPRAATEFVGFLKNLAPKGFDSADMRQEYERRIADSEGRGAPIGGGARGEGGRPAGGGNTAVAERQRTETNERLAALEKRMGEHTEALVAVGERIERATRDVGPDVGDPVMHGAKERSQLRRDIYDGHDDEEGYRGMGGERHGRRDW